MDEDGPVADLPLVPYRAGLGVGGAVAALVALVVVLGVGIDPLRVLLMLGVFVLVYGGGTALTRLFVHRPVIPDAGVPRAAEPEQPDPRAAFRRGVWAGFGLLAITGVMFGLLAWLFDDWTLLAIVPGVVLIGPIDAAREVPALRRWEAAHGVRLHTRREGRRRWMVGPRDSDLLVAVPTGSRDLASPDERS